MSEILSARNIVAKPADSWRVEYCVRCDDGRQVVVEAACSWPVEAFRTKEVRAYVADNGRARALAETDKNEPGITHIRLWVDAANGRIRVDPR
jgi:hypothetical protein